MSIPRTLGVLLAVAAAGAGAPAASAATITFNGTTLVYTAAPGESNALGFFVNTFDDSCDGPCFEVSDRITSVPASCRRDESGEKASCPQPTSVVSTLGDGDDGVFDWDGPSRIDLGPGTDVADGAGGDDVLLGGIGNDNLKGQAGNDTL